MSCIFLVKLLKAVLSVHLGLTYKHLQMTYCRTLQLCRAGSENWRQIHNNRILTFCTKASITRSELEGTFLTDMCWNHVGVEWVEKWKGTLLLLCARMTSQRHWQLGDMNFERTRPGVCECEIWAAFRKRAWRPCYPRTISIHALY